MRTLAPELEAVNLGSYNVVIKAKFWQSFKGVGTPTEVTDIYSFNLTATDLVIELAGNPISIYTKWVKLYRGATINGTDYTVETSYFSINKITATPSSTKIEATLLPKITINIAGDDTYTNVLTNFATACGLTASFTDASATYWNYQFLPAGKNLAMNDANNIKALLKQKYIMLCADRGNDTINFTHYRDKSAYLTADIELETADSYLNVLRTTVGYKSQKRFLWRDETTATNYDGVAGDPIHNLGYLETTDSPPVSHANNQDFSWKNLAVDLRLENNDYLAEWEADHGDGYRYALFPIEVTERFDGKKSPSWCMDIQVSQIFSNTEGGAMPSTIERVAAYTPLVSSGFDGNLTPEVNNLQALAEAVDDLPLGGSSAPATTAINDFQVGDGSGNWITKTLAQVITILGIFADAASDSIYYVRRNATWTNLKTYTDTLYATLTHASRHQSGGADAIKLDDLATRVGDDLVVGIAAQSQMALQHLAPLEGILVPVGPAAQQVMQPVVGHPVLAAVCPVAVQDQWQRRHGLRQDAHACVHRRQAQGTIG